ncbi:MAG: hypothetical protein ABSC21_16805 [Terriglobia bacterium]|jgi:vacuolar-type H+-ATPase subunit I/STV1
MKKRLSSQNAPGGGAAAESHSKSDAVPSAATQQPTEGSAGTEKTEAASARTYRTDVGQLHEDQQNLVRKMLVDGATFEDVVEAVNEQEGDGITLNAIQNYFQESLEIQQKRVRRLIESAETLLASVDKDPKSAEARLARATFLTGYSRVRRNASLITPKDAERSRMERENLSLKHQILTIQRKKATQDLDYSRARTRLILLTQGKLQEEILKLQREVKAHRPGEPMGPEMLQRIQQLYGLACQPLLYEESADASTKT